MGMAGWRSSRFSRWSALRHSAMVRSAVAATVAAVMVANLGGGGISALPSGERGSGPRHVAAQKPGQRWGSAAGQDHLAGRPGNRTVPRSQRGQYPLRRLDAKPQQARNVATVAPAPAPAAHGFDRASSREVAAARDAHRRVYDNADGTQTTEFAASPINYRRPDGSWAPIDPRLSAVDGGWRNAADAVDLRLAGRADAASLVRLAVDRGHVVSFGLAGAAPVAGHVDGDEVTYSQVLPDVDLRLVAQPGGVKETLVLGSAGAPRSYVFPLRLTGLTARLADRGVELTDAGGVVRAMIPAGFMVDSAGVTSGGVSYQLIGPTLRVSVDSAWLHDPARRYPVTVDPTVGPPVAGGAADSAMYVSGGGSASGGSELRVGRVDGADTASYVRFGGLVDQLRFHTIFGAQLQVVNYDSTSCRARPVTIHPVTGSWTAGTGSSYPGPAVGPALASKSFAHGYIATGQSTSACPAAAELIDLGGAGRTLVQGWVNGTRANNGLSLRASVSDSSAGKRFTGTSTANPPKLFVTHSPYNATYAIPNPVPVPPVLQNQAGKVSVTVTNLSAEAWTPTTYYLAYRAYNAVTGVAVTQKRTADLSGTVARGARTTLQATIQPLPPGKYFLDFTMVRAGGVVFTDHQVPPGRIVLQVFDIPPVLQELYPPNGYQAPTLSPQLWARGLDVDAPAGSTLQYKFEVCDRDTAGNPTGCTNSGYQARMAWTVPAGRLRWSQTYLWRAFVKDATTETPSAYSALLTAVPQPEITSRVAAAPYGTQDREFDAQVGNFSTAALDAPVATVGPQLSVVRTYNSLDPRTDAAFGAGWTTQYDMRLVFDDDGSGNVVVTYPDGEQVRFGRNPDGTYAPPPGRTASLTVDTGVWKLLDKSGVTYTFITGQLTRISEVYGRSVVLTYDPANGGRLAKAQVANSQTNTAGRSLTFTWTGGHIGSVRTDPVNGAALTWTYTYDGDKLTRVCAPDSTCTSYEYVTGSHYRSAVLDSRPESYWRLGEAEGTAAGSEIAVNLGKDAASYKTATLGTAGALAGADNTAVTLNGSSSYVDLPKGTLKRSRDAAVELWFKASLTGAGGPLLGYQDKAVGQTSTAGVPLLYLGTDRKVRGQFATGTIAPITSSVEIRDDRWHHAVLTATGGTQTLYLDGAKVGELTNATIEQSVLSYNEIGAAYATTPGSWPAWGTTSQRYFAGAVDEVAVYSHPLGPAAVTAHYRAGTTATGEMSRVVLPSGKVAAEIEYNVDADRVSAYTDRDGGTWKIGLPTVFGGDDDLRRTIQVLDPANRPSLYEYDALAGRLLRSGTPLGLATREEDRPGEPSPSPSPSPTEVCSAPDSTDPGFCTTIPGSAAGPVFVGHTLEGMAIRSYSYDDRGFQNVVTDENGDSVTLTFDDRGNVTSRKTCRTGTECHTAYYTYPAVTNEFDPRNDLPTEFRDARSASATDNTYRTRYSYVAGGLVTVQTNPDGSHVDTTYTIGAEAAKDGIMPSGLPLTVTDARAKVTRYDYYHNGDQYQVKSPSGLITTFVYDAIGRKVSETEYSDSYPSGLTTSYTYDALSRLSTVTEPATTDAVTGTRHQARTTNEYDADGNLAKVTVTDLLGGDPARVTTYEYDEHNRVSREVDAEGNESTYDYDRFGNRTSMVDANGNRYEYAYTARNQIAEVRLRDWASDPPGSPDPGDYLVLHSYSYDFAGRMASDTDAMGRRLEYVYYRDGLLQRITLKNFHNPNGGTRDYVVEENTYDGAGNLVRKVGGNGTLVTTYTVDALGQVKQAVADPAGLVRKTAYAYDGNGNVVQARRSGQWSNASGGALTDAETVDYRYDDAGNPVSETVSDGSGATVVTSYTYDRRGLLTSTTDPRGNVAGADKAAYTTTYRYDELGRQVATIAPPVPVESGGSAPQTTNPTTTTGYNAFDEAVAVKDELGNVSRATYDRLGRQVTAAGPTYTPPGASTAITPVTKTSYDGLGNVVAVVDPRDNVSRYTYDQLSRLTVLDEPASTNDERAVTRYTYTRTGEVLSVTGPTGARVESTYDDLDRQVTQTEVERRPVPDNFTTRFTYDDAGNVTRVDSPTGAATTNAYDAVGALVRTVDPNGVTMQYGYDFANRQVRMVDGFGRVSFFSHDLFGRMRAQSDVAANGTVLRLQTYAYDAVGNLTSATDPLGHATTYAYDALNQLVRQTEPVSDTKSITTTFGYDAAANRTRYTDGRGNTTVYTYNALGLAESVVEPATATHPAAADRTWTVGYDAAGQPVRAVAPGGVVRQRSYDAGGRLTAESGSGAEATTTARSLGYDLADRLTSAGGNTFSYDDRDDLLSANGPSGTAAFGYDADGNLTSRTDAAGTATFGYTNGRLATITDAAARVTQTLGYDAAGQVKTVNYGSGRVRTFGYDDFGRLSSDQLTNSAGQAVASISYGFDLNDHVTSKVTTGTAGSGTNSYSYDFAGRLTSWTSASGTVGYEWDDSGNRVKAGSKTATFDERNRLLSDGDYTYAYTARGTLRSRTSSGLAEPYAFDAFDRLTSAAGTSYSYDPLDRVVARNGTAFAYAGLSDDVVSDGASTYARGPDDDLLAVATGSDVRLSLSDAHGDVVAEFDPTDTSLPALADSAAYDPFGKVIAHNGETGAVGYQGDWTDSATGQVDMGARWYQPGTGTFTSHDSATYGGGDSILANPYTYGAGAPLDFVDPDGQLPSLKAGLKKVGGVIKSGASKVVSGAKWVASNVSYYASTAWTYASYYSSMAWSAVRSAASYVWNGISSAASWVYNKAKSAVSTVVAKIKAGVHWVADKARSVANWAKQKAAQARQAAIAKAKAITAAAKKAVATAIRYSPLPALKAALKPVLSGLRKVVSAAANLPAKVVSTVRNVVDDAAKAATAVYQKAVEAAGTVQQNVSKAVESAANWVDEHKAAVVGGLAGFAVGLGCGALIGWTGVGAVACGALGGAVGSFVTGYMSGERGWSLAASTLTGAAAGGLTGGLFSVGGAALSGGFRSLASGGLRGFATGARGAASGEFRSILSGRLSGGLLSKAGTARGSLGGSCLRPGNSFTATTPVLMADGSHKLISQVHVGDQVLATDPTTGHTAPRTVTDVIVGTGEKHLVAVGVSDGKTKPVTITATDQHPFWVDSENRWIDAKDLKPGYEFETADHRSATVTGTRIWTEHQRVYNLTVDADHTYYVGAGETSVLVHNDKCDPVDHPGGPDRDGLSANEPTRPEPNAQGRARAEQLEKGAEAFGQTADYIAQVTEPAGVDLPDMPTGASGPEALGVAIFAIGSVGKAIIKRIVRSWRTPR
jgi:RHS repeat-associated protein